MPENQLTELVSVFRSVTEELPKPKKVREKTPTEVIREKSSTPAASDRSEGRDSNPEPKEPADELGSLSSKLLDKLAEEESKLKKLSNLEIGTWSNEMAENVQSLPDDADDVNCSFVCWCLSSASKQRW